jgi:hypothetical protein
LAIPHPIVWHRQLVNGDHHAISWGNENEHLEIGIPSGKHWDNYQKTHFVIGNWPCSIAMLRAIEHGQLAMTKCVF